MGRIADAIRGIGLPEQKQRQMLTLDQEFSDMEAQIKSLHAENLHLKAEVNPLQRQVDALKQRMQKLEQESAQDVRAGLTFSDHAGVWSDESGRKYCPKCIADGKRYQLKNEAHGWKCMVCGQYFSDPDRPPGVINAKPRGGGPNSWMK